MRTYKRKTPERNEIEDVQELCRLCLDKTEFGLPIFRDEQDVCAAIAMRIMICVGLEMKQEDCLPNIICESCYNELERYYEFRRKCEVTYHKLKSHVLAVKYKELKDMKHKNKQMDNKVMSVQHMDMETEHKYIEIELKNPDIENSSRQIEHKYIEIELKDRNIENSGSQMEHKYIQMENKCMQIENEDMQMENKDKPMEQKIQTEQPVEVKPASESPMEKNHHFCNENQGLAPEQTSEKLPEQVPEHMTDKDVETEEIQVPVEAKSNPNIDIFLTGILTELGILETKEESLIFHGEGITSFELETGDKEQLVLELVEESEDVDDQVEIDIEDPSPDSLNVDTNGLLKEIKPKAKQSNKGVRKVSGPWCSTCGRAFSTRSAAARHARAHAGERAHRCPECARTFAQKAVMERHRLVHLEVRPHQCAQCDKSFTQRGSLEAHMRTHSAPTARPLALHRCSHCTKVFLYASGLSRHVMTHLGRVYECSACDKQFKDRSSLLRHMKNFFHNTDSKSLTSVVYKANAS